MGSEQLEESHHLRGFMSNMGAFQGGTTMPHVRLFESSSDCNGFVHGFMTGCVSGGPFNLHPKS